MKVDGIIGLAPVIQDMGDYSFIYQIMTMLKVDKSEPRFGMQFDIQRKIGS